MNLSRLTDRIDPAAAKVAVRAAIFMPVCFALASTFLPDGARVFASFGAFILLAMVTFSGRPLPRVVAWLCLVLTGCALIAIGTVLSQFTVLAALAGGLIAFVIIFSGVVSPYLAAARNGAVLLIALPLMIEVDASMIGPRIGGWLLACAICIPATYLVWRLPWIGGLRRQAARTSRALAALVREPSAKELRDAASDQVWKLRKLFLSTPNRPTGATGVSASLANVVDEQAWMYGIATNPLAEIDDDGEPGRRLREETAVLLESSADLLLGERDDVSTDRIRTALDELVDESTAGLKRHLMAEPGPSDEGAPGSTDQEHIFHRLDHEFRLRKMAYSAIDIAQTSEVAAGHVRAPGALGEIWSWAAATGRKTAVSTGRLIARHSGLDSSWLRNSIRAALGIGLAVLVADLVAAQNAFWVVLGTLSILRSNALGTRGSIVAALLGTVAGIAIGSVVIVVLGEAEHILWVALPLAVFFAAYAQRAVSFAAGQAGFSLLVMVLYNLIEPVGWEVGLIRFQDVALGCAVSLVVGLLAWPRGAAEMIRGALARSLEAGAELIRDRSRGVLEGRAGAPGDGLWDESVEASELLDAALRRYLDESTGDHIDRESLMALSAAGLRLRRTAVGIGRIPQQDWFSTPGVEDSEELGVRIDQCCDAYRELARSVAGDLPVVEVPDPDSPDWLLAGPAQGEKEFRRELARVWLFENLQYLAELHHRYAERARMLDDVSSENPPPTGDAPMPRHTPFPAAVPARTA